MRWFGHTDPNAHANTDPYTNWHPVTYAHRYSDSSYFYANSHTFFRQSFLGGLRCGHDTGIARELGDFLYPWPSQLHTYGYMRAGHELGDQ